MHFPAPYTVPPPTYSYRTSPASSSEGLYNYVKYPLYTPSPPRPDGRNHSRRASHSPVTYAYAPPQTMPGYFAPPQYSYPTAVAPAGVAYTTKPAAPKQRRDDIVTLKEHARTKASRSAGQSPPKQPKGTSNKKQQPSSRPQKATTVRAKESEEYVDQSAPPLTYEDESYQYAYPTGIDVTYKETRGRARAASHPTPKPQHRPQRSQKKEDKKVKAPRQATPKDASDAGIPAGFSYKNWDPDEPPILLLGSVFDANSLGKWIYDWTVSHHGPNAPISDLAGDLWLLLIELSGKSQRLDECYPRVRREEDKANAHDFLESSDRIWERLNQILKSCEAYMYVAAEKDSKSKKVVAMTSNSGIEFVESIFGRDRELENTEKLMARLRHWTMRWDEVCEKICRRYSA